MTVLENHRLVLRSKGDLESSLADVENKLHQATDPIVRREYEESLAAIKKRLTTLETVELKLERTDAQLLSLAGKMDQTLTEIVRIQGLDPDLAKSQVAEVVENLEGQISELVQFQKIVGDISIIEG
jgi:hypothetical protein